MSRLVLFRRRMTNGDHHSSLQPRDALVPAIEGNFDGFHNGSIYGWAWTPGIDTPLRIRVLVDGQVIDTVEPREFRQDLLQAEKAAGKCGFSVALPRHFWDARAHLLTAEWVVGEFSGTLQGAPRSVVIPHPMLQQNDCMDGYLDGVEGVMITGWCGLLPAYAAPESVEIFCDNEPARAVRCTLFRLDLQQRGFGDGHLGFQLRIPTPLLDGKSHEVAAVVTLPTGERRNLKNSPRLITFPALHRGSAGRGLGIDRRLSVFANHELSVPLRQLQTLEQRPPGVTIIVPIYNAPESLARCLDALRRHTPRPYHLMLVDDASNDSRVSDILRSFEKQVDTTVVRHAHNRGFTFVVNEAITQRGTDDVILLNSDAIVGPFWLQRLRWAAAGHPLAGTVTPFSNNAGVFSAPIAEDASRPNLPPSEIPPPDDAARVVARGSARRHLTAPTGHGFCLYIRREVLDRIGLFDADHFGRGYGGESDFCTRAVEAGFVNIVADDVYVVHEEAASFGQEKAALQRAAQRQLQEIHPEYEARVTRFFRSVPFAEARIGITDSLSTARTRVRPRLLFVLHHLDASGTPWTTLDLARTRALQDQWEPWLLVTAYSGFELYRITIESAAPVLEAQWKAESAVEVFDLRRGDVDALYAEILQTYAFELVHVRHQMGGTLGLPAVARTLGIPVVLSLHDFYLICPTVRLLDENLCFCGGDCTPTPGDCTPARGTQFPIQLKHAWIEKWRHGVRENLRHVDALVTTSQFARDLHLRHYPELAGHPFEIIEHGRDFPMAAEWAPEPPAADAPLRCVALGNYDAGKGLSVLLEGHRLGAASMLDLHFLGRTPRQAAEIGTTHGPYERENVVERLHGLRPHVVLLLSQMPETWCHSLTEAWAAGLPVIATSIGALAERVGRSGAGWLIPCDDAPALLDLVQRIRRSPEEYDRVRERVRHATGGSCESMAAQYVKLYRQVCDRRLAGAESG